MLLLVIAACKQKQLCVVHTLFTAYVISSVPQREKLKKSKSTSRQTEHNQYSAFPASLTTQMEESNAVSCHVLFDYS